MRTERCWQLKIVEMMKMSDSMITIIMNSCDIQARTFSSREQVIPAKETGNKVGKMSLDEESTLVREEKKNQRAFTHQYFGDKFQLIL